MGACNIELTLSKKVSRNEIYDAFKKQQDQDRLESLVKTEKEKAFKKAKPSQFNTMLAGWGAC